MLSLPARPVTAKGRAEALAMIDALAPFAAADLHMPGMNGVDLLEALRRRRPDTVRVVLSGNPNQGTTLHATTRGVVSRFLTEPCDTDEMVAVFHDIVRQHELVRSEKVRLRQTLRGGVKLLVGLPGLVDPVSQARAAKLRRWARWWRRTCAAPRAGCCRARAGRSPGRCVRR